MVSDGLPVLVIDGRCFDDLPGFAREFSGLLDRYVWTDSLDAFNDVLRGGFGTPEGGFVLRWLYSSRSQGALGWAATEDWLSRALQRCHPSGREHMAERLAQARRREGTTLFDWIVEILRDHGPGGREAESKVYLELM